MKKVTMLFLLSLFFIMVKVEALTKAPVDVTTMSITELYDAMNKGYLTSEVLVNIYLERIEAYDKLFNSINQINTKAIDEAKELDNMRTNGEIKGRLHGIPILVKSNIDVVGLSTNAGTTALAKNYPKEDATVIKRLKDEGAIILGSTNMSALAFSASNSYSAYGYVKNVFNVDYTPYGSSGGSAVSVGAAFAAASLGTDTNSSVRLPASGAGLVGIRPTYGLVSHSGVVPYDFERDTVGVLSRNVADNALLLEIISGADEKDLTTADAVSMKYEFNDSLEGVTIGVLTQYVKGSSKESGVTGKTDDGIYSLLVNSIEKLENRGAKIVYIDDFVKNSNLAIASDTIAGITMCDYFNEYIKGTDGPIKNFKDLASSKGRVWNLSGYLKGCNSSATSKQKRDNKKSQYRSYVDSSFEKYELDVVLYPTLKNRVFAYNKTGNISPGSSFGSVIGYPSITVPMGFLDDGFSYGIEFLSLGSNESILYDVAYQFETENQNEINASSLTPSLYEVYSEVLELISIYNSVYTRNNDGQVNAWINNVKAYFNDYNNLENVQEEAIKLLMAFNELGVKIETQEEIRYWNPFEVLAFCMILLSLIVIFRNVLNCFR